MNWLEISLIVDGELAEAIADIFARHVDGVVIESTQIDTSTDDEGHVVGPLRVCAYLEVNAQLEETRQKIEESLWYLGRIRPLPAPTFKPVQEVNWAETWKKHYQPVAIGQRLMIVPPWIEPPDASRIPIRIEPGMAFGTGTHPTTQLCLDFLETYTPQGGDVLDIGCGSGILSIAAVQLGAKQAYGVDVEKPAISAAYKNAEMNGVADQVHFALGSVDTVQAGVFEIAQAPLVLANILAPILMRLLDAGMADLIAPGGSLMLSGILEEQVPMMLAKIQEHGLQSIAQKQVDDWVALVVQLV